MWHKTQKERTALPCPDPAAPVRSCCAYGPQDQKRNDPWLPYTSVLSQSRVISVLSWYLTSLVNLSFYGVHFDLIWLFLIVFSVPSLRYFFSSYNYVVNICLSDRLWFDIAFHPAPFSKHFLSLFSLKREALMLELGDLRLCPGVFSLCFWNPTFLWRNSFIDTCPVYCHH